MSIFYIEHINIENIIIILSIISKSTIISVKIVDKIVNKISVTEYQTVFNIL